ncbi:hypothetical protein HELRODRAFT_183249 [Helobdella robusta]|uniref:Uncharacterized protein n=1 Tax=Helobdella robusta TaxID=6412 RepID=T1FJD3_HELRO|nr:hypothetical protein HELRODRAFT_183249 [Helobdella robusta]ESO11369.1 hypothetical protein HELRODRAFT_183249 [Helobdella robusta]
MGIDVNFSYRKARALSNYMLHHPDVLYLATNMQPNYVRRNSRFMPGWFNISLHRDSILYILFRIKAQSKMIKELSGRKPDYVIGKPEEPIFRVLLSQIVIDLSRTLLIGHRLETDILFAYRAKISSMLVLSGMASLVDARKAEFSDRLIERASCPDFFVENIHKLHELLHKQNVHQLQERKMTIKNLHLYLPRVMDEKDEEEDFDYFVDNVASKVSIPIASSRSKPVSLVSKVTGSQTTNVKTGNVSYVTNTSTTDDAQLNIGYYMKNVKYTNYKALVAAANEAATELLSDNN